MSDEYKEEKKADFRLILAKMYRIKPENERLGFYDNKKVENFREQWRKND